MNTEEKARAYDEALERAREAKQNTESAVTIGVLEEVFPQLAEDYDERIRKNIKIALMSVEEELADFYYTHHTSQEELLTWLEKQGEPKSYWKPTKEQYEALDYAYNSCSDTEKGNYYEGVLETLIEDLHRFEKQGNPADKVEPKFHVGDWIISNKAHEDYRVCKITDIKNGYYTIESIYGYKGYNHFNVFEESYRLWSIEDAKVGDVLVYEDEISLYKHDIKNCTKQETTFGGFVYYCCYDGKRFITDSLYSLTEQDKMDIHPATKEQRELLFSKMKESGYEWDAKESKKIVEKHSWKPGDIVRLKDDNGKRWQIAKAADPENYEEWFISEIRESGIAGGWVSTYILDTDYVFVENPADDAALLVKKEFEKVKSAVSDCKEETSWSEEDDRTLGYLLAVLEDGIPTDSGKMGKIVDWLRTLKQRIGG